jgi:hypothetical protein
MAEPDAPKREDEIDERISGSFDPATRAQLEELRNHQDAVTARQGMNLGTSSDDIKSQEESPTITGPWADKTTPQDQKSEPGGLKGFIATSKKRGPLGFIIALLISGAVGVSFLTPGLLLLHVTETITDKLNMQFSSLDIRTNRVLTKKISNQALSGVCTQPVTIRCKFNSLNDRQLEHLRSAGIDIELQENTTITGRHKPVSMKWRGEAIDPSDLNRMLRENPELRTAFKRAYNPKFASFADNIFAKAAERLKISKAAPFQPGITDEERAEAMKEATKEGMATESGGRKYIKNDDGDWVYEDDPDAKVDVTDSEAATHNSAVDSSTPLKSGIDEIGSSGEKRTGAVISAAQEALEHPERHFDAKQLTGVALGGLVAAPDAACSFYGLYREVSFGAKTIRSGQMARYAQTFLTVSSMIKAGEATPEDVSYLGNLLTKTVQETTTNDDGSSGTVTTKAATDSYGYRYAAYGDTGPLTASAAEFTAGGGLGGKMTGLANEIFSWLPGGNNQAQTKELCGVIKSPLGQAAAVVVSIGLVVFGGPIGWGALAGGVLVGGAMDLAVSAASTILTPILADMVAGILIDDTVFGEKAGDALVSGSGVIMSTVAGLGGNAPLTPEEAVAYTNTQNEVIAQYASVIRAPPLFAWEASGSAII